MKQLNIDDAVAEKSTDNLTGGLPVHQGIPIPNDMPLPGQDGYRTPNVQDYERHIAATHPNLQRRSKELPGSKIDTPLQTPLISSAILNKQSPNLNNLNLALEALHWRERIRHFTWTFFTMTMATGGIANVLYTVPFRFHGLETIGNIFFLFNLVLFIMNITLISLRFYTFPETFKASYMHPSERLFLPASVVSFGTVLINISQYGLSHSGPWLGRAVRVLFWTDAALAVLASSGIYLLMWSTKSFTVEQMTPIWIFPAYPLLIVGPHASILSKSLPPDQALNIIIGGFTIQGVGFLVAFMIYASFIYRLMTQKLPQASSRPGMFVSVGPSGFTVAGVVGMAESLNKNLPSNFMGDGHLTSTILRILANWACLWIWGLACWFFLVSVGAHWSCAKHDGSIGFNMTWFSFVFPNTALITATFAIGKAFNSKAIQIVGCVMTVLLIIAWFLVFGMMIRAIKNKRILWPQKGEDKDEGGFKAPARRERRGALEKLASGVSQGESN